MKSGQMIESDLAALVVVDVQEKMLSAITSRPPERVVDRIQRLARAALILDIPIFLTEQYPKGLGPTDARIRQALLAIAAPIVKNTCSCWRDEAFRRALQLSGREHIILVGLEAHVCIQQTAMDLVRMDYSVFVAADACGSRYAEDSDIALARMSQCGVEVSTAESLIFELIERCDHPRFKDVLELVK